MTGILVGIQRVDSFRASREQTEPTPGPAQEDSDKSLEVGPH